MENKALDIADRIGNKILEGINTNNPLLVQENITRICSTLSVLNYPFDEPIVSFFKKEKSLIYGKNIEVRAKGKVYFQTWNPQTATEKSITPICAKGGTINVMTKQCNCCVDCQVPKDFSDIISLQKSQLCAIIDEDDLRGISCGLDVYNELVAMTENQISQARNETPFNCIMNILNDKTNYSLQDGVNSVFCCNKCTGDNIITAIKKLAYKLRNDASAYNKDGRIYRLPLMQQVLIVSEDLDAKLSSIWANTFNTNFNDIRSDFGAYFVVPLTVGDFIIADRNWLQFYEGINRIRSKEDFSSRSTCVTADYDFALKGINFMAALFGNLTEIDCSVEKAVKEAEQKILADTTQLEGTTQAAAETAVKTQLETLIDKDKVTIDVTTNSFTAPTSTAVGSIESKIVIKDKASGAVLDTITKVYTLKQIAGLAKNK